MQKIIAVVGPTATGKSDLGVLLAKKFNGEIISADSRQVYKGMDIGTGKITKKEMLGVKHHLLDIASPKTTFNAIKFKKQAEAKIKEIASRGKLPILVGGTGFWIDAVAFNQSFPDVPPNPELRKKLNQLPAEKLFNILKKLNPERAQNIDWQNKRRVIRAIEIARGSKRPKKSKGLTANSAPNSAAATVPKLKYQTLFIGLDMPDEVLTKKITTRLDKRLKQGMVKEVEKLHKNGVSWQKLDEFGLEYRFVAQYLQNQISKQQMRELLLIAVRNYSKRQRTWFKRNKEIIWLNPTDKTTKKAAYTASSEFLA
ncbi:MAG: miaA [Candidatus Doudnabacteria bacterium]|nr:miaA [Candidatus Doudnabacteria bacterium]